MRQAVRIGLATALLAGAGPVPAAGPLAAQGSGTCEPGQRYEVDFGIQGLSSRQMEFSVRDVDGVQVRRVSFGAEPTVTAVRAGGPADGRLRAGDVIVGIDGQLITTRAAGERWSAVEAGERVVLTVRRDGRETRVGLTTGQRCARVSPAPPAPAATAAVSPPGGARPAAPPAPGSVARAAAAGSAVGRAVVAGRVAGATMAAPPAPPAPAALPDGWFGFGISCSDCLMWTGPGAEGPAFRFSVPPEVESVEPGTPAAAAGLEAGDLLLAIDGVALTSEAGGRAFARVEPGQSVRFRIRRDARALDLTMRAIAREGRETAPTAWVFGRGEARTPLPTSVFLRGERIGSVWETTGTAAPTVSRTLRYSGTVGNAVVEVRGSPSVVVSEVRPGGDVIIRVGQTEIRVTAPPGGG